MAQATWEFAGERAKARELWFQITGRDAVVAVKLDFIEGRGDAIPAGHGSGFCSAHARHRCHDDVAEAQGFADQHDFQLDRDADCQLPGAQKIDASGADVASDKRYGKFLGESACTAKTQREVQSGTGVFTLLWMHAHGVRRHPDKAPRLRRTQKRRQAQHREARHNWHQLRSGSGSASLFDRIVWPRFKWNYALRRPHQALRDATALSLASAQQT